MRIHFQNISVPTRAAKRLKNMLFFTESQARGTTALVLGYKNWHELSSAIGTGPISLLDEDCSPTEFAERFAYQAARLSEVIGWAPEQDLPYAEQVLRKWKPSAARPQEEADLEAQNPESKEAQERRRLAFQVLDDLSSHKNIIWTADQIEEIFTQALPCFSGYVERALLSYHAARLTDFNVKSYVEVGLRLLEKLAGLDDRHAQYELALVLMKTGSVSDAKRAYAMFERCVADDISIPVDHSVAAKTAIGRALYTGWGCSKDAPAALSLWEQVVLGSSTEEAADAAYCLGEAYNPQTPGAVSSDVVRAIGYYKVAVKAEVGAARVPLAKLLRAYPNMMTSDAEVDVLLVAAAEAGDGEAKALLAQKTKVEELVDGMDDKMEKIYNGIASAFGFGGAATYSELTSDKLTASEKAEVKARVLQLALQKSRSRQKPETTETK